MNYILLFGMPGGAEIIIILLVIIMFFGADKIPEFARMFGKGMREVKNATNDIQREIKGGISPITDITDKIDVKKQVKDLMSDEGNYSPSLKEDIADKKEEEIKSSKAKEDTSTEEISESQPTMGYNPKANKKIVARKSPYTKEEPESPKEEKE